MRQSPRTREEWIRIVWAPLLVPFLVNFCLCHFAREWVVQGSRWVFPFLLWFAVIALIAYPLPWKLSPKNLLRSNTHGSARDPSFSTHAIGFLFPVVHSVGFGVMGEHYSLPLNAFVQLLNLLLSVWAVTVFSTERQANQRVEFEL